MHFKHLFSTLSVLLWTSQAQANSLVLGRLAILKMAGCFQVDYSYTEVEALKTDYSLDPRVYDATEHRNIKEYIMLLEDNSTQIRLQRILFIEGAPGQPDFIMKHHGENWTYQKNWQYDYQGNWRWNPQVLSAPEGSWTREVNDLDDGPRYHCTSTWLNKNNTDDSEWQCSNFAPIPGRETRDMGRKDYNALQRSSRLISYPWGLLERQNNIKTIYAQGTKTPLAREVGKIFNIKLAENKCDKARFWAQERTDFWQLTREVWLELADGSKPIALRKEVQGVPAYVKLWQLEAQFYKNLNDEALVQQVKNKIKALLEEYIQ